MNSRTNTMKYARCLEMSPATTSTSGVRTCDSAMSLLRTIGEVSEISTGISSNWTVSSNGGSMRLICKHFRDNRSRTLGRLSVLWSTINLKLVGNIMDPDPDANTRRWNHSLQKKFGSKCLCKHGKVIKSFKKTIHVLHTQNGEHIDITFLPFHYAVLEK